MLMASVNQEFQKSTANMTCHCSAVFEGSDGRTQQLGLTLRRGLRDVLESSGDVFTHMSGLGCCLSAEHRGLGWPGFSDTVAAWELHGCSEFQKLNLHPLSDLGSEVTQHPFCCIYWLVNESHPVKSKKGIYTPFLDGISVKEIAASF